MQDLFETLDEQYSEITRDERVDRQLEQQQNMFYELIAAIGSQFPDLENEIERRISKLL